MHRFIDGEDRMQPALLPHPNGGFGGQEEPFRLLDDNGRAPPRSPEWERRICRIMQFMHARTTTRGR
jgi:hypothetical protein